MGFRDDFFNGYRLQPIGRRQRTFAEWSLEDTVDSGLRATRDQVHQLRTEIGASFEAGIGRLEQANSETNRVLQRELEVQTEQMLTVIARTSGQVVDALQEACDYLGGELCEIRWAIERQTGISARMLDVLLNSLDNASRQYWEQGVRCYEASELDIARERFDLALESNRTNHFAYQYLGFIAVNQDKADEAIKHFERAAKFSDGYHRAIAFSHLARSLNAAGDVENALKATASATKAAPNHARFWYESGIFLARQSRPSDALQAIQRAITCDWTYWAVSLSDANLESMRKDVVALLNVMRSVERSYATRSLEIARQTQHLLAASSIDIVPNATAHQEALHRSEKLFAEGTVFSFRQTSEVINKSSTDCLSALVRAIDLQTAKGHSALNDFRVREQAPLWTPRSQVESAKAEVERIEKAYHEHIQSSVHLFDIGAYGCGGTFLVFIVGSVLGGALIVGGVLEQASGDSLFRYLLLVGGLVSFALAVPLRRHFQLTLPANGARSQVNRLRAQLAKTEDELAVKLAEESRRWQEANRVLTNLKGECHRLLSLITADKNQMARS